MSKKTRRHLGWSLFIRYGAGITADEARTLPDSFSPEFYYLIQQKARLELSRSGVSMKSRSLLFAPYFAVKAGMDLLRLHIVNALVTSYLNESALLKSMEASDRPREEDDLKR